MAGIDSNYNFFNTSNSYSTQQAPKEDPNAYAQEYANQNGISVDEAKTKLAEMFGDPQQGTRLPGIDSSGSIFDVNNTSSTNSISSSDASTPGSSSLLSKFLDFFSGTNISAQDAMDKDPDDLAQQYADENGISIEEAKQELSAQFGAPEQR